MAGVGRDGFRGEAEATDTISRKALKVESPLVWKLFMVLQQRKSRQLQRGGIDELVRCDLQIERRQ